MTESPRELVLRRKLEAGAPDPALAVAGLPPVEKALGLAMARVSDKLMELVVAAESTGQVTRSLAELLDEVPENGLYALLEGPQEAQGVMVLDNALMGALIEKQTAGALVAGSPTARKPTRTDAALCADWIDAVLRALAETFAEAVAASWLSGFAFSCHLPDARPLGLMLEDEPYRVLDFSLDIEAGARKGAGKLILPALGRAPEGRPASAEEGDAAPHPDDRAAWERRIEAQVMEAEVVLTAVLHRFDRSIAEVLDFAPGDLLTLPESAIGRLRLETGDGTAVSGGRLGQSAGLRAVRLTEQGTEGAAEADDPLGAAMALLDEEVDAAESDDLPDMPDLPDLPDLPEGDGLPDLPDLPEIGGSDEPGGLPELAGVEDLPDLPELPELDGALPDLPEIDDLGDLTGT
ncbi:FliM/FliN family flagellar motor switch protein [Vannielia litorea]|uniref:FliM/FliN family flagellar motor switch protein n=1 Tax=Vannielia litorea TaxID=1217970 RepID=UPI001BCE77F3|nr:FliM/FliN family flagellar motor switch protein [Vannielia litorea]